MKNGNRKGKVGEREWRDELRAQGFTARRGQQFSGGPDSPDVICPELFEYHFEVKRVEKLNVLDAMLQAIRDAGSKTPVLAHRRNRGEWLVTMRASDWFKMLREILPPRVFIADPPSPETTKAMETLTAGPVHYYKAEPKQPL